MVVLVSGAHAQIGGLAPGGLAGPQGLGTLNPDEASGGRLIHPPTTQASSTGQGGPRRDSMKTMVIVALIVLSAAASVSPAAAIWQFPTPVAPAPRQCRVGGWYLAQFWETDEWGNAVTWVAYTPYYVCH